VSQHEEFPELTQEAERAISKYPGGAGVNFGWHRRNLAASLREAIEQADPMRPGFESRLCAIAYNLHSPPPPPPPPPTLAQAREADMDTPEGRDVVRDFLATLVEWVQP
jgi:hypothetical protein